MVCDGNRLHHRACALSLFLWRSNAVRGLGACERVVVSNTSFCRSGCGGDWLYPGYQLMFVVLGAAPAAVGTSKPM